MAKFKPFFEIDLPKEYSPDERRSIAAEIIDDIINRTEGGKDKNGDNFKKYSKEYAKSKGQSNVDLTFSGDMLSAMELVAEKSGKIRIGYTSDYDGVGKVEGNVLGTYGNKSPVVKGRDFLGIPDGALKKILKNYPVQNKEERQSRVADVYAANVVAEQILKNSGIETNGEAP